MRTPPRPRGMTLIELLIGLAVGSFVMLAISATFISQARQYQAHSSRRSIQAGTRQALSLMDRTLRRAGYGVDPDRAIIPYDSFDAASNGQVAGFPDAVAVHSRDPAFRRRAISVTANELELDAPLSAPLQRGQIMLVLCPGARTYAYVTLERAVAAGETRLALDSAAAPVDSPAGPPGAHFREEEELDTSAPGSQCYRGAEQPWVVKVDRRAFYVAAFPQPDTGRPLPYLMLHQGLDLNADGTIDAQDAVPVAEGVEQLQLAYILNTIHTSNSATERLPPLILGMGEAVDAGWRYGEQWDLGALAGEEPRFDHAYDDPRRLTTHPANIRQVRLTLVARSTNADPNYAGDDALNPAEAWATGTYGATPIWRQLENLGANPAANFDPRGGGVYRTVLRQAVAPKNMLSRSQFLPITAGGG